jgi:hypothetical protein
VIALFVGNKPQQTVYLPVFFIYLFIGIGFDIVLEKFMIKKSSLQLLE